MAPKPQPKRAGSQVRRSASNVVGRSSSKVGRSSSKNLGRANSKSAVVGRTTSLGAAVGRTSSKPLAMGSKTLGTIGRTTSKGASSVPVPSTTSKGKSTHSSRGTRTPMKSVRISESAMKQVRKSGSKSLGKTKGDSKSPSSARVTAESGSGAGTVTSRSKVGSSSIINKSRKSSRQSGSKKVETNSIRYRSTQPVVEKWIRSSVLTAGDPLTEKEKRYYELEEKNYDRSFAGKKRWWIVRDCRGRIADILFGHEAAVNIKYNIEANRDKAWTYKRVAKSRARAKIEKKTRDGGMDDHEDDNSSDSEIGLEEVTARDSKTTEFQILTSTAKAKGKAACMSTVKAQGKGVLGGSSSSSKVVPRKDNIVKPKGKPMERMAKKAGVHNNMDEAHMGNADTVTSMKILMGKAKLKVRTKTGDLDFFAYEEEIDQIDPNTNLEIEYVDPDVILENRAAMVIGDVRNRIYYPYILPSEYIHKVFWTRLSEFWLVIFEALDFLNGTEEELDIKSLNWTVIFTICQEAFSSNKDIQRHLAIKEKLGIRNNVVNNVVNTVEDGAVQQRIALQQEKEQRMENHGKASESESESEDDLLADDNKPKRAKKNSCITTHKTQLSADIEALEHRYSQMTDKVSLVVPTSSHARNRKSGNSGSTVSLRKSGITVKGQSSKLGKSSTTVNSKLAKSTTTRNSSFIFPRGSEATTNSLTVFKKSPTPSPSPSSPSESEFGSFNGKGRGKASMKTFKIRSANVKNPPTWGELPIDSFNWGTKIASNGHILNPTYVDANVRTDDFEEVEDRLLLEVAQRAAIKKGALVGWMQHRLGERGKKASLDIVRYPIQVLQCGIVGVELKFEETPTAIKLISQMRTAKNLGMRPSAVATLEEYNEYNSKIQKPKFNKPMVGSATTAFGNNMNSMNGNLLLGDAFENNDKNFYDRDARNERDSRTSNGDAPDLFLDGATMKGASELGEEATAASSRTKEPIVLSLADLVECKEVVFLNKLYRAGVHARVENGVKRAALGTGKEKFVHTFPTANPVSSGSDSLVSGKGRNFFAKKGRPFGDRRMAWTVGEIRVLKNVGDIWLDYNDWIDIHEAFHYEIKEYVKQEVSDLDAVFKKEKKEIQNTDWVAIANKHIDQETGELKVLVRGNMWLVWDRYALERLELAEQFQARTIWDNSANTSQVTTLTGTDSINNTRKTLNRRTSTSVMGRKSSTAYAGVRKSGTITKTSSRATSRATLPVPGGLKKTVSFQAGRQERRTPVSSTQDEPSLPKTSSSSETLSKTLSRTLSSKTDARFKNKVSAAPLFDKNGPLASVLSDRSTDGLIKTVSLSDGSLLKTVSLKEGGITKTFSLRSWPTRVTNESSRSTNSTNRRSDVNGIEEFDSNGKKTIVFKDSRFLKDPSSLETIIFGFAGSGASPSTRSSNERQEFPKLKQGLDNCSIKVTGEVLDRASIVAALDRPVNMWYKTLVEDVGKTDSKDSTKAKDAAQSSPAAASPLAASKQASAVLNPRTKPGDACAARKKFLEKHKDDMQPYIVGKKIEDLTARYAEKIVFLKGLHSGEKPRTRIQLQKRWWQLNARNRKMGDSRDNKLDRLRQGLAIIPETLEKSNLNRTGSKESAAGSKGSRPGQGDLWNTIEPWSTDEEEILIACLDEQIADLSNTRDAIVSDTVLQELIKKTISARTNVVIDKRTGKIGTNKEKTRDGKKLGTSILPDEEFRHNLFDGFAEAIRWGEDAYRQEREYEERVTTVERLSEVKGEDKEMLGEPVRDKSATGKKDKAKQADLERLTESKDDPLPSGHIREDEEFVSQHGKKSGSSSSSPTALVVAKKDATAKEKAKSTAVTTGINKVLLKKKEANEKRIEIALMFEEGDVDGLQAELIKGTMVKFRVESLRKSDRREAQGMPRFPMRGGREILMKLFEIKEEVTNPAWVADILSIAVDLNTGRAIGGLFTLNPLPQGNAESQKKRAFFAQRNSQLFHAMDFMGANAGREQSGIFFGGAGAEQSERIGAGMDSRAGTGTALSFAGIMDPNSTASSSVRKSTSLVAEMLGTNGIAPDERSGDESLRNSVLLGNYSREVDSFGGGVVENPVDKKGDTFADDKLYDKLAHGGITPGDGRNIRDSKLSVIDELPAFKSKSFTGLANNMSFSSTGGLYQMDSLASVPNLQKATGSGIFGTKSFGKSFLIEDFGGFDNLASRRLSTTSMYSQKEYAVAELEEKARKEALVKAIASQGRRFWSEEEDAIIRQYLPVFGNRWGEIAKMLPTRTARQVRERVINTVRFRKLWQAVRARIARGELFEGDVDEAKRKKTNTSTAKKIPLGRHSDPDSKYMQDRPNSARRLSQMSNPSVSALVSAMNSPTGSKDSVSKGSLGTITAGDLGSSKRSLADSPGESPRSSISLGAGNHLLDAPETTMKKGGLSNGEMTKSVKHFRTSMQASSVGTFSPPERLESFDRGSLGSRATTGSGDDLGRRCSTRSVNSLYSLGNEEDVQGDQSWTRSEDRILFAVVKKSLWYNKIDWKYVASHFKAPKSGKGSKTKDGDPTEVVGSGSAASGKKPLAKSEASGKAKGKATAGKVAEGEMTSSDESSYPSSDVEGNPSPRRIISKDARACFLRAKKVLPNLFPNYEYAERQSEIRRAGREVSQKVSLRESVKLIADGTIVGAADLGGCKNKQDLSNKLNKALEKLKNTKGNSKETKGNPKGTKGNTGGNDTKDSTGGSKGTTDANRCDDNNGRQVLVNDAANTKDFEKNYAETGDILNNTFYTDQKIDEIIQKHHGIIPKPRKEVIKKQLAKEIAVIKADEERLRRKEIELGVPLGSLAPALPGLDVRGLMVPMAKNIGTGTGTPGPRPSGGPPLSMGPLSGKDSVVGPNSAQNSNADGAIGAIGPRTLNSDTVIGENDMNGMNIPSNNPILVGHAAPGQGELGTKKVQDEIDLYFSGKSRKVLEEFRKYGNFDDIRSEVLKYKKIPEDRAPPRRTRGRPPKPKKKIIPKSKGRPRKISTLAESDVMGTLAESDAVMGTPTITSDDGRQPKQISGPIRSVPRNEASSQSLGTSKKTSSSTGAKPSSARVKK